MRYAAGIDSEESQFSKSREYLDNKHKCSKHYEKVVLGKGLYEKSGLDGSRWTFWFIRIVIWAVQMFHLLTVWPIIKWNSYKTKVERVPPITDPILLHSAEQLGAKIRNREISSQEVVKAYIKRVEEINPIVNAVVQDRFTEALEDARDVDAKIKKNPDPTFWKKHKPLYGIPVSIKESIAVAGMSHNAGTLKWNRVANRDSPAVSNLRAAGAIPFVVTNTPELCAFWETYNYVTGTTKNLFNTKMTAGGSSGGECVLIGSGASPFGLGSDVGGSGRLPAQHSGIFGHKPTGGIISIKGHFPLSSDPIWDGFLVISPQARHTSDLYLLMKAAAPQASLQLHLDEQVNIQQLNLYFLKPLVNWNTEAVAEEIQVAIDAVLSHFNTQHSLDIREVSIENFDTLLIIVMIVMSGVKSPPKTVLTESDDTSDLRILRCIIEWIKVVFGYSKYTMYAVHIVALLLITRTLPRRLKKSCVIYKELLAKEIEETLGETGVIILPVSTTTAKEHMTSYYKSSSFIYLLMTNLLDLPATSVPIGFDKNGLPVSIQVVAKRGNDRLTFAVARELEDTFGGWLLPRRE